MNKKYIALLCGVAVLALIAGIVLSGGFSCGKDIPAYKIYSYDGSASSMSRLVGRPISCCSARPITVLWRIGLSLS